MAKLDRVEWRVIPDSATAGNALIAGEVDWLELPQPDLIPLLKTKHGRDAPACSTSTAPWACCGRTTCWRRPTTPACAGRCSPPSISAR